MTPGWALEDGMAGARVDATGHAPGPSCTCQIVAVLPPSRPGNASSGGRPLKPNASLPRGGPMAGNIMRRCADRHRGACATPLRGRRRFVAHDEFGALELDHQSPDNGQLEMHRIDEEPTFLSVQSDFLPESPFCSSIFPAHPPPPVFGLPGLRHSDVTN